MYSYSFSPVLIGLLEYVKTKNGTSISLIDVFTNNIDHKITSGNLVTDISDHFPNFISTKGSRHDITKPKNKLIGQSKPNNIKGFKNSCKLGLYH